MRIGIDLNASFTSIRPERRAQLVFCLALLALCAGCNAVVNFGDFEFGKGGKRDSGTPDSGPAADGGGGADTDGSVADDGGASDGSAGGDAATVTDGSIPDGGGADSGGADSGMSCPSDVEICDNGVDDDCDQQSDCDDDDCAGVGACCSTTPENTQAACSDDRDNDCSGQKDCGDSSCSSTLACCTSTGAENSLATCGDGVDDDCDGKVDCADPECSGLAACCGIVTNGIGETVSACCTPDGSTDDDPGRQNDGVDNDCDGLTDKPILQSAFPTQGLPASGAEVTLNFVPEMNPAATLSCSTKRLGQPQSFVACPLSGASVKPFSASQSADPSNNGIWKTQVRWDFPDGKHSSIANFQYYIHNSLNNVAHCPSTYHTDQQWFTKAHTRLGVGANWDAGAFRLGLDTFLLSPFIRVTYKVPVSGTPALIMKYMLNGQTPTVDMRSLRHRFTLSNGLGLAAGSNSPAGTANRYLLITRNYKSLRNPTSCNTATIRVHVSHWSNTVPSRNHFYRYGCAAIVMNRAGVGVCMDYGPTSAADPVLNASKDSWDGYPLTSDPWPKANKFMWRNLMEDTNGGLRNFSPKCTTMGCTGGTYLPDLAQFPQ
jgi:hypothetical protein